MLQEIVSVRPVPLISTFESTGIPICTCSLTDLPFDCKLKEFIFGIDSSDSYRLKLEQGFSLDNLIKPKAVVTKTCSIPWS